MQNLVFQTPTQWAVLGLLLFAGWMFGLATAPGGRKWRERCHEAELESAQYRDEAELLIREAKNKIHDLTVERDAALAGAPAAAALPAVSDDAPGEGWRGWFGWGRDNLVRIRGIDEAREKRLNELGIKTYREIEKMSAEDEASLEERLGLTQGAIGRQEWREQAALLRAGNEDEHGRRFGLSAALPLAAAAAVGAATAAIAIKAEAHHQAEPQAAPEAAEQPEAAAAEAQPADETPADEAPVAEASAVDAPAVAAAPGEAPAPLAEAAPAEAAVEATPVETVVEAEPAPSEVAADPAPAYQPPAPEAVVQSGPAAHVWLPDHVRSPSSEPVS